MDFLRRPRLSRIYYNREFFDDPLKPLNALMGLGPWESILIVLSYVKWRILPYRQEETFEQWVTNRFGRRLFRTFFKSYTEKVWGIPCSELKAEWAAQRITGLSFASAIFYMFLGSANKVRTLAEEFLYPRRGPGIPPSSAARSDPCRRQSSCEESTRRRASARDRAEPPDREWRSGWCDRA